MVVRMKLPLSFEILISHICLRLALISDSWLLDDGPPQNFREADDWHDCSLLEKIKRFKNLLSIPSGTLPILARFTNPSATTTMNGVRYDNSTSRISLSSIYRTAIYLQLPAAKKY